MKFIQSIAILLISVALQFGCCSQSDKLAEILKYCHNNGHKYVSILGDDASQFKPYSLLLNSIDIRGRFVNLDNFDTLVGSLDFLIVERGKSLTFAKILKIMNERNIQESLLVIKEEEVQEFKVRNHYFLKKLHKYSLPIITGIFKRFCNKFLFLCVNNFIKI